MLEPHVNDEKVREPPRMAQPEKKNPGPAEIRGGGARVDKCGTTAQERYNRMCSGRGVGYKHFLGEREYCRLRLRREREAHNLPYFAGPYRVSESGQLVEEGPSVTHIGAHFN